MTLSADRPPARTLMRTPPTPRPAVENSAAPAVEHDDGALTAPGVVHVVDERPRVQLNASSVVGPADSLVALPERSTL